MNNPKRRTITTIISFIIAACLITIVLVCSYLVRVIILEIAGGMDDIESYAEVYQLMNDKADAAEDEARQDLLSGVRLTASAIRMSAEEPKVGSFRNGYIVRADDNGMDASSDLPYKFTIDLSKEYGTTESDTYVIAYACISDDYYYVEYTPFESAYWDAYSKIDMETAFENLAKADECDYALVTSPDAQGESYVITATGDYSHTNKASEIGITEKKLSRPNTIVTSGAIIHGKPHLLLIGAETHDLLRVVMLMPMSAALERTAEQTSIVVGLMMILLIPLGVWILSIYYTLRQKSLTDSQKKRYCPSSVKRKTAMLVVAATLIVGVGAMITQSLDCLFSQSTKGSLVLNESFKRISDDKERTSQLWKTSQERNTQNALRIASLLDNLPELHTKKWLDTACKLMDADYIMIFDAQGNEVLTNSRYRGLSLGTDESSSTYDFRRLLNGVPRLSHDNVTDEVTGLTRDLHGISLRYLAEKDGYGAMIVAVDPEEYNQIAFSDISNVLVAMTPVDGITFAVDPESKEIVYSSEEGYIGRNVLDNGMTEKELISSYIGFIKFDGKTYYAKSAEYDDLLYFYATERNAIVNQAWMYSKLSMILFLVTACILMLIVLKGYKNNIFEEYADQGEALVEENIFFNADSNNAASRLEQFSRRNALTVFRKDTSPGNRAVASFELLILVYTAAMSISLITNRMDTDEERTVIEYISRGDWEAGVNLFSFSAILFLIAILILALSLIRMLSGILNSFLDTKGQTITSIIVNIIHYIALIVFMFIALGYLGINTRAMFASVGLAGLALTLGAKDLVADIFSGVSIITEGTYHVGDIVEIGGFRGEVSDVGMRTTKLIGRGGNVKTLRNSNILDVVNLSRLNSWYALQLTLSSDVSLADVEKMLNEELPEIGKKNPKIISGPHYRGVDSIEGDKTTILILTECNQEDYNKVQRFVTREVKLLFDKNNIHLY